jgi:folate-dependent phosphoribosylglycinamide formyltransferase PurN
MKTADNWVALTSRTGKTLAEVSRRLDVQPKVTAIAKTRSEHNKLMDQLRNLSKTKYRETVNITLFGYMWIIPEDVTEMFNIYNLHPGPIHLANCGWLKGKDPIERSFIEDNCFTSKGIKYYRQGSVIHKVTAGVDEGEIVCKAHFWATDMKDAYQQSFDVNVGLWSMFLIEQGITK